MSKGYLLGLGNALFAADEPPHAGEVENADPQPVPKPVIRTAVPARPVNDVDIADGEAFAADERGEKAMQPVEIRQRQEQVAAERFEPASAIARAVLEHGVAHAIGDIRLQLLKTARLAADALTGVAAARAPIVVTIDGDGQNDPAFIPALVAALEAGAPRIGLIAGQRVGRKASGFKKLQSNIANGARAAATPVRIAADWPADFSWRIWRSHGRCAIKPRNSASVASREPSLT